MNTQNVQNALNETNALIRQLEPIIASVKQQEQAIINHRVSLDYQLTRLREKAEFYTRMLENEKED
jgi:hypothetical protein